MLARTRTTHWQGRTYVFQRLQCAGPSDITEEWAVSRGGEFIGTLQSAADLSVREFDLRCLQWLTDLLGRHGGPSLRARDTSAL
ncbi:MAG TPA: hypothetical protein VJQ46_06085 [Gemmatimonadales bacterium]|nr:hypothetical protein [Gemmatimonadales bacterium]